MNGSEFIVDGTVELELSDAADDTVEDYYEIVFEDQELYPTAITQGDCDGATYQGIFVQGTIYSEESAVLTVDS